MRKHLLQSWFNESYKGLKEQGRKSSDGISCSYNFKLEDGTVLHCGVGHLIKDIPLDNKLNTKKIFELIECSTNVREALSNPNNTEILFLTRLQKCHDSTNSDTSFLTNLTYEYIDLAKVYDLNTNVIDEMNNG
jgi:hypothetical protein